MSYIKQKDLQGDTYTLRAAQDGSDVDIQLDAASGTDSEVKLKAGTNITLTEAADTVTIDSAGAGGSIGVNQVAFGDPLNAGDIKGSDNFTFVDESGGSGPTTVLKGDKPILQMEDDTGTTNFITELQQSGASMFVLARRTGAETDLQELMRLQRSEIAINDDGEDCNVRIEGVTDVNLFVADASSDNVGFGTAPDASAAKVQIDVGNSTQRALDLISRDSDASASPTLRLNRISGTPAPSDDIGVIDFVGKDDGGNDTTYARISALVSDETGATEDGWLQFGASFAGNIQPNMMTIRGDVPEVVVNEGSGDVNLRVESNANANAFMVDAGKDSVGIGTAPDSGIERLHVKGTGLTDMVVFEGTSEGSGANDGPDLILYNSATPTGANKFIGRLEYRGKNDAASTKPYGSIQTFIQDETAGTEDSLMLFKTMTAGSAIEKLRLNLGGTELNATGSASLNFDVKTSSSTQQSFFKTYNSATLADRYTEVLRGTLTVSATPRTITEDYCYGSNVCTASGASVINLPEGLPGMHLQVVNKNISGITIAPAVGDTINGSASSYSVQHGWVIAKAICVAAGEWVIAEAS